MLWWAKVYTGRLSEDPDDELAFLGLLFVEGQILQLSNFQAFATGHPSEDTINAAFAAAMDPGAIAMVGGMTGKGAIRMAQAVRDLISERAGVSGRFQSFKNLPTRAGYDRHHLLEKRLAKALGVAPGDIPADYVSPKTHRGPGSITSQIRERLPYGNDYGPKDVQRIWDTYKAVYQKAGRSDWIEVIWPYFRAFGVQR